MNVEESRGQLYNALSFSRMRPDFILTVAFSFKVINAWNQHKT